VTHLSLSTLKDAELHGLEAYRGPLGTSVYLSLSTFQAGSTALGTSELFGTHLESLLLGRADTFWSVGDEDEVVAGGGDGRDGATTPAAAVNTHLSVILDEAELLHPHVQDVLRVLLETVSPDTVRLIFVVSRLSVLSLPQQSRLQALRVPAPTEADLCAYADSRDPVSWRAFAKPETRQATHFFLRQRLWELGESTVPVFECPSPSAQQGLRQLVLSGVPVPHLLSTVDPADACRSAEADRRRVLSLGAEGGVSQCHWAFRVGEP